MKLFLASKFHLVADSIASNLSAAQKSKIVFVETAIKYREFKGGELAWHYANKEAMQRLGMRFDTYDIRGKSTGDLAHDLGQYATIYVEGGNTGFLMQEAEKCSFGGYLHKRVAEGMVYISESAGSVCAGADIAANSRPGKSHLDYDLDSTAGFGLVNYCIVPHWGQPSKKADHLTYKIPQSYKADYPYILLTNYQYLAVTDNGWQIISTKKGYE